jgi:AraC-like DNA-binding protein
VRYFRLLTDTVAYQLDERATPYRFRLLQPAGLHPALNLRNECALAGFCRVFRQFVGPELQFEFVSFRHSAPGEVERYEDYFNCPVRFQADENAIALVPPMLDLPTRLGDPAVSRFLTDHLDTELGALSTEATIERVLAEHLSEALSDGIPKAGSVARAVGMSERTLYRRLSEAGLSYQDVLENTQKSLAENLLSEDRFSIAEVAFLTGFAEQSSFNRAFKRWAGQTPGAFRKGVHPA